ncbi:DUF3592 domain-containing protein [Micromonospora sp. SL1-18]|uniref:DUF3592 domain-containing protein n=1 Tax=Micromonospora sp. SL1-18 TaxID=3399128 RepID=UPI003A4D1FAA
MAPGRSDRLAKVLLVASVLSGILFLLAASSVFKTISQRNGVYDDGRVAEARVLRVSPGRDGEAQLEYVANGDRYEGRAYCGAWCPKVGDLVEVEYAASNPGRVTLLDDKEFSTIAVAWLFGAPVAILIMVPLLRRELRNVMSMANSAYGGQNSHAARPKSPQGQLSTYRKRVGLIAFASGLGGIVMLNTRGVTIPGSVLLGLSVLSAGAFIWLVYGDSKAR